MANGENTFPGWVVGPLQAIVVVLIGISVFAPIFLALYFVWFEAPVGSPPNRQMVRFEGALSLVGTILSWEVIGVAAAWLFRKEIALLVGRILGRPPTQSNHGG